MDAPAVGTAGSAGQLGVGVVVGSPAGGARPKLRECLAGPAEPSSSVPVVPLAPGVGLSPAAPSLKEWLRPAGHQR